MLVSIRCLHLKLKPGFRLIGNDNSSVIGLSKMMQYSVDIINLSSVEIQLLQLDWVVVTQNMLDHKLIKEKRGNGQMIFRACPKTMNTLI